MAQIFEFSDISNKPAKCENYLFLHGNDSLKVKKAQLQFYVPM